MHSTECKVLLVRSTECAKHVLTQHTCTDNRLTANKAAPTGQWADLPIELWGRILVLAYQQYCGGGRDDYASHGSLHAEFSFPRLYKQLLVCKTINAAFVKQSWLYRDLLVPAHATWVEALQEWTQHHYAAIENIVAGQELTGAECQSRLKDLALVALCDHGACLRSAHCWGNMHDNQLAFNLLYHNTMCVSRPD